MNENSIVNPIINTIIESLQAEIKQGIFKVNAGGSKTALSSDATMDLAPLSGILEYDPQEYTLTALAGTPLKHLEATLEAQNQYMPFDPVMVEAGATLGGTIASGLSGSGRYRYGGIRDFLLGIKFITGTGKLQSGGGKVVKNAAGFDLPKLFVGSLGQFGIMTEATIKVFPKPESFSTLICDFDSFEETLEAMTKVATSSSELTCLDIVNDTQLVMRVAGTQEAMGRRLERLQNLVKAGKVLKTDEGYWQNAREFNWLPANHSLIKIPTTLTKSLNLEKALNSFATPIPRQYAVAGNVAYLGLPNAIDKSNFDQSLLDLGLSGLAITGDWDKVLLGKQTGQAFTKRILSVLNPEHALTI